MLKPATNALLKLVKQELSNKPKRPSGKHFRASGLFIPSGRFRHFQPTLPASAKSPTEERDRKRRLNPTGEALNDLNKLTQQLVMEDKRSKWQSAVDKCDHGTGILHLCWLVKGLSDKKRTTRPSRASE